MATEWAAAARGLAATECGRRRRGGVGGSEGNGEGGGGEGDSEGGSGEGDGGRGEGSGEGGGGGAPTKLRGWVKDPSSLPMAQSVVVAVMSLLGLRRKQAISFGVLPKQ